MGSELASEFMLDHGMCYPLADYNGYYRTGNESPGEWEERHFFGLDGQNIRYSTEGSYTYYMPRYEYAQPFYNPYNPYIPGAIEYDGTSVGAQSFSANPSFQQITSLPAYLPFIVHPTSEIAPLPYDTLDYSNKIISSVPSNHDSSVQTFAPPLASTIRVPTTGKVSSANAYVEPSKLEYDGTSVGAQSFSTNPSFQQVTSSPTYLPFIIHPTSEIAPLPYVTLDSSNFSIISSVPGNHDGSVQTFTPPLASATRVPTTGKVSSVNASVESSKFFSNEIKVTSNKPEESKVIGQPKKHSALNGVSLPGVPSPSTQVRNSCNPGQAVTHITDDNSCSFHNPSKSKFDTKDGFINIEHKLPNSAIVDKLGSKFQNLSHRILDDGDISSGICTWQSQGPRTIGARCQGTYDSISKDNSGLVFANNYNKSVLLVDYLDAKFFVIKSYSEDDVHKSIKYNVWSSTIYGNKKLNAAFEDSQKILAGEQEKCPIFLFFSVNGSGHFCGVAEMIGAVNFLKDMDFWQHNKWTGSFPVKWHIVKDIPNTKLRHILLENNENKPVTHSRDTQELLYVPGMTMLKVFKDSPLGMSILDDFLYYEEKEKFMQLERSNTLQKNHGSSLYVPVFVPSSTSISTVKESVPFNQQLNDIVNHHSIADVQPTNNMVLIKDQKIQHDNFVQTVAAHIKDEKYSTKHHPRVENQAKSEEASACQVSASDTIVVCRPTKNDEMQLQKTVRKLAKVARGEPKGEASHCQKVGENANSSKYLAPESDGDNMLRKLKYNQLIISDIITIGSVQIKLRNSHVS